MHAILICATPTQTSGGTITLPPYVAINMAADVEVLPRNFKGGIGSNFDPCFNTMGRWPYLLSRIEVSYCTFGFAAITRRDQRILSFPRDSQLNNPYACVT